MNNKPDFVSGLTPVIVTENAHELIKNYEQALGAEVCGILECPQSGKVAHACLKLNDSSLFVYDAFPEMGMNPTGRQQFYLYVDNTDEAFAKAEKSGWTAKEQPDSKFWGDRTGTLEDSNGNTWLLAQKERDVTMEEMTEAMKNMGEAA